MFHETFRFGLLAPLGRRSHQEEAQMSESAPLMEMRPKQTVATDWPRSARSFDRQRDAVAFVLPGGASHAAVQVGMLMALAEAGIRADFVVGTSAGAVNAAAYAADPTSAGLSRLADAWRSVKRSDIFPLRASTLLLGAIGRRNYLLPDTGLRTLIKHFISADRLEITPIAVHVMATDLATGQPTVLSSGQMVLSLLASCAIPSIFPPVEIGGRLLVDGGVSADTPVLQAENLGAKTIYVLPTFGTGPDPRRGSSALQMGLHGAARHASVRVIPAPPTSGISPFRLRESARLIDEAVDLTHSWLESSRTLADALA
jgi:NTE family protein